MSALLQFYKKAMEEWSDPRVKDIVLFQSPVVMLTFVVGYLLVCFKIGPKFMKDREPFNINKVLIGYNICQMLLNVYGVIVVTPIIINQNWRCSTVDYEDKNNGLIGLGIQFLLLKAFDFLDTIFFILRKNYRQITFLHVYHHASMVFFTWMIIKFICGGPIIYIAYFNVIVHTVMYFYYLLCIINENHKKSIWWKKHLTQLQIAQFGLVFLIFFQQLFRDCAFPRVVVIAVLINTSLITSLFASFYYKAYIKPNNRKDQ